MLSGEHLLRLPVLTQGSGKKFPSKAEFLTNIFEAPRRALYPSLRAPASRSGWFPPWGSPPPARADPAGNHGGGDSTETGRAAARRPRGILLPQGAASTGDAPPIVVVAKSAKLRFRLRRKLRPLPCSSSPHRAGRGGGPFRACQKRNGPCTVQREKCVARCGAVALRADGGRRIGASADFGPPSGTLGPSAIFLTAVPRREYQPCRGGYRMELLLFSLPLAAPRGNWRSGPIKASAPTEIPSALRILWGPTCVSALARVTKATSPVGADALVRPPAQAATTAQAARSDCAAVGGSAVLRMRRAPCGQAERAEGGASGTLVTEIRGAPQRETGKEERFKCARVLQSKTHYAAGIRR